MGVGTGGGGEVGDETAAGKTVGQGDLEGGKGELEGGKGEAEGEMGEAEDQKKEAEVPPAGAAVEGTFLKSVFSTTSSGFSFSLLFSSLSALPAVSSGLWPPWTSAGGRGTGTWMKSGTKPSELVQHLLPAPALPLGSLGWGAGGAGAHASPAGSGGQGNIPSSKRPRNPRN